MEEKVEFKSLKDRINLFGGKTQSNARRATILPGSNLQLKLKIIPKSETLEKINNMIIYKYPNKPFEKNVANNSKILLFLGNAQECFINSFINIYRGIEFKDDFRYKIKLDDKNMKYDIYSMDNNNIRIISLPFCREKNESYLQLISEICKSKYNLVCYTLDENINDLNPEHLKEIEFYKYLINYLDLSDKLVFLCSSKEEIKNEEMEKFTKRFKAQKNDDIYEDKNFRNEIIFINNKNMYDDNNNNEAQKDWDSLKQKIETLKKALKQEKRKEIEKVKIDFFNFLLMNKEEEVRKYFIKLKRTDQYYFIYFLGEIKFKEDRSKILHTLINSIIKDNNHKKINLDDNEIEFTDDNIYKKIIRALSKLPFSNLKKIIFRNCWLCDEDENINQLKNIITTNLENLDLSQNKLREFHNILSDNIVNLTDLDLSNNNISNLSQFKDMKLNNLVNFNLSFNKISDIECLGMENNFDKLEKLNLSNNNIQKLKIINIKSLKHLDLLKNDISEGIVDFMKNNKAFSNSLNLKFETTDSVLFQFDNKLNIEFTYNLCGKNYEQFFEELNLNEIKEIKILKSDVFDQDVHYNIDNTDVDFKGDKNYILFNIITKFEFKQIKKLKLTNCQLTDKNIKILDILFTSNLENLNLSNNAIQDISIFTENEKLNNLKQLNLGHNDISDVSSLSNSKLTNLLELDLSFNKIENIDFIELSSNLNNLEKLDLSNNQIKKTVKNNLKNIKYLNLLNNEINEGIKEFIQSIKGLSHKLILELSTNTSFQCEYDDSLILKFKYFLKDNNDITQFLKEYPFDEINNLKIKGFDNNNIKFFSNETLKDIKELDLQDNSLTIISIFENIHFPDANTIKLNKNNFSDDSLVNLKNNFTSIKVKSIAINLNRINLKFINPELEINHSNFNILHDDMGEVDKIEFEEFPNDLDIFAYNSFSKKELPIFKNIKVDNLNIIFENEKYIGEMVFKPINFKAIYTFDNLDFMKSDDILSEITRIKFSNVTIDQNMDFEKDMAYKNLEEIELNKCIIENIDIFDYVNNKIRNNDLKIVSKGVKCKPTKCMDKSFFEMEKERDVKKISREYTKEKLKNEDGVLKYTDPFNFKIEINDNNRYNLIKNAYLRNIEEIDFSNAGIKNIDFLANSTLKNLRELSLKENNIEDISIFTVEKIHFHELNSLYLEKNPIKKGLEVLKEKFFKKCIYVKLDLVKNELKILARFNYYRYNLDIYVSDLSEVSNIFEKDKVFFDKYLSSEVADKFKEIFSLDSEDYDKKIQTLEFLSKSGNYWGGYETQWIYELKEEEFKNKKEGIYSALKLLSNNDNNTLDVKKLFSDLDIYLNSNKFNIILPSFDLYSFVSIDKLKNLTYIYFSWKSYFDIKLLCESEYLSNLKTLHLKYMSQIDNINCFKEAKFVDLKELYLNNNHLDDINFLANAPFTHLEKLDVSNNNINELPDLNFPELTYFNLKDNKINLAEKFYKIGSSTCKFILKGNYITESMLQDGGLENKVFDLGL